MGAGEQGQVQLQTQRNLPSDCRAPREGAGRKHRVEVSYGRTRGGRHPPRSRREACGVAGTAWAHAGGPDAHAAQERKQLRVLRDGAGAGTGSARRGAGLRRMPGAFQPVRPAAPESPAQGRAHSPTLATGTHTRALRARNPSCSRGL